jgi:hypothetical protein
MALKGKKQTPEHIAKRTASALRTKANWTEEQRRIAMKHLSEAHKGYVQSEESKRKRSKTMKGKQNSLGVKRPLSFRKHLSEYWKDNPNHNHWIDGKYAERKSKRAKEMSGLEYRLWRQAVFNRDSYTCQLCGKVGRELHADHIKPYSLFPELRFDVDNGRTLCSICHKGTDTFAWKMAYKIREHGGHDACRETWEEVDA